jgi:hypothetical protein
MIVHAGTPFHLLQLLNLFILLAATIASLVMLRALAGGIARGTPFDAANVTRLRRFGWLLIGVFVWIAVHAALSQWLLVGHVALADGARLLPSMSGGSPGAENIRILFDLEPGWLAGGLIALALAEAFRIGADYRQDSEEVV